MKGSALERRWEQWTLLSSDEILGKGGQKSDGLIGECEMGDGPVGGILSRNGLEEAEDGRFPGSEGANRSALCLGETAAGEKVEDRGLAVSEVWWGIVIPKAAMSGISSAEAASGKFTGMRGLSRLV